MSILRELAKENLLYIALQGCRAVLEKELDIPSVVFSVSAASRQELIRRYREEGKLKFPYSFVTLSSLAGVKERQSNYAIQKHGLRFNIPGQRATTAKGYLFPITLGLDFHYYDSDPKRLLEIAQALVMLSLTNGLSFQINVGDMFTYIVEMEIPLDTTINLEDPNAPEAPGASDVNVQIIMHTTIGFFRDVSSVNSGSPKIEVLVQGSDAFQLDVIIP